MPEVIEEASERFEQSCGMLISGGRP
jgi:hypothetical protein